MSIEKHFSVARFNPREIKEAVSKAEGFNAKFAILITRGVGTMACAYVFAVIAFISLPSALNSGQLIVIISWIAQTFLQLVLLSIIMVGQNVQSIASDSRSQRTYEDAVTILDRLDERTEGGIKTILDRLDQIAPLTK